MAKDKFGREIMQGDLVRSFHFRGRRHRIHYLYHVAMIRKSDLYLVPVSEAAGLKPDGGVILARYAESSGCEIIHGNGPDGNQWWYERPKEKPNGEH